jgi:hypothetical protein
LLTTEGGKAETPLFSSVLLQELLDANQCQCFYMVKTSKSNKAYQKTTQGAFRNGDNYDHVLVHLDREK